MTKPEDYTYEVMALSREHHYGVVKMLGNLYMEDYTVEIIPGREDFPKCNCPGFERQKYPKILHKHIKLVARWFDEGRPVGMKFKLVGKGQDIKVEIVEQEENNDR